MDWRQKLSKETAIYVYIDLANVFHWQEKLGWGFRIEDLISSIRALGNVKEIKVYFGDNPNAPEQSKATEKRFRKAGAIYKTKPVKFIKKSLEEVIHVRQATLANFSTSANKTLTALLHELQKQKLVIEEPKCNFDVEMTMDMLDDEAKLSCVLLLSGDSDLAAPLERLKIKGKAICVVAVRGSVGHELKTVADTYISFGKLYSGKKRMHKARTSENPTQGGAARIVSKNLQSNNSKNMSKSQSAQQRNKSDQHRRSVETLGLSGHGDTKSIAKKTEKVSLRGKRKKP